jgi:hypothetical protein
MMNIHIDPGLGLQADRQLNIARNFMTRTNGKDKEIVQVMVITHNILLGDLLEILLTDAFISPVHRVQQTHPDDVLQRINRFQPQVIIVEEGIMDDTFLLLLNRWSARGRRRVILVHPQKNSVQVDGEFQVSLTHSADFIALIENNSGYGP